jgi:hypothetical protein
VGGARDDLLADAALALNQDGHVRFAHLLQNGADLLHRRAGPYDAIAVALQLFAQHLTLALEALLLEHLVECRLEFLFLEGFVDVVGSAELHGFDDGTRLADHR